MTYRTPDLPPPRAAILLHGFDGTRFFLGFSAMFFGVFAFAFGIVVAFAHTKGLFAFGAMLIGVAFFFGLFGVIRFARVTRFRIELRDQGVRLVHLNGAVAGDTADGSLTFTRVNYTRRTRHSAYLRPGWLVRHATGQHLVGTLLPQPPWDGAAHVPAVPEFELGAPAFEDVALQLQK